MSILISMDPGKHYVAWARFDWNLLEAGYSPVDSVRCGPADLLVIEKPVIYPQSRQKGDPNDLIDLAVVVGQMIGQMNAVTHVVTPAQWKGQRTKTVTRQYVKRALSELETQRLHRIQVPSSAWHNVYDAVAIGLWKLGRLWRNNE